jgi:hypothetical protein
MKMRRSLKDPILKMETPMCHIGRLECPSSIVRGNHDEREDDYEVATNYVEPGESYIEIPLLLINISPQKLLSQGILIQNKSP